MNVQIDEGQIILDRQTLRYNPYWIDIAAEEVSSNRLAVMQQVLAQWAEAVAGLNREGQTLFLPYSLDDEWTECFEARLQGNYVVLQCVQVAFNGYSVELNNLSQFMHRAPEIRMKYPENFGQYQQAELVSALRKASTSAP